MLKVVSDYVKRKLQNYSEYYQLWLDIWKQCPGASLIEDFKELLVLRRSLHKEQEALALELIEIHKEQIRFFELIGFKEEAEEHKRDLKKFEWAMFKPGIISFFESFIEIVTNRT